MNKADKAALIAHLEAALAILNKPEASAQSGGTGNGPPEPPEGP